MEHLGPIQPSNMWDAMEMDVDELWASDSDGEQDAADALVAGVASVPALTAINVRVPSLPLRVLIHTGASGTSATVTDGELQAAVASTAERDEM